MYSRPLSTYKFLFFFFLLKNIFLLNTETLYYFKSISIVNLKCSQILEGSYPEI